STGKGHWRAGSALSGIAQQPSHRPPRPVPRLASQSLCRWHAAPSACCVSRSTRSDLTLPTLRARPRPDTWTQACQQPLPPLIPVSSPVNVISRQSSGYHAPGKKPVGSRETVDPVSTRARQGRPSRLQPIHRPPL
ncbi:unnamed protein product, partial [Gadus morhua 'NCC']